MLVMFAPAVCAVARFMFIWGGMTPPSQRANVGGLNAAGPADGAWRGGKASAIFFLPIFAIACKGVPLVRIRRNRRDRRARHRSIAVSTYDVASGRYSGMWNAVKSLPCVWNRSPLIIGLSMLGGAVLMVWLAALPRRERWGFGRPAVVAFGAAQAATHGAYQRYYEPLVLIAAAISLPGFADNTARWAWAGPVLLSAILAAITVISLAMMRRWIHKDAFDSRATPIKSIHDRRAAGAGSGQRAGSQRSTKAKNLSACLDPSALG